MSTDNALGVPWMKEYPRLEIVPRNSPLLKELDLGGEKLLVLAFPHPKGMELLEKGVRPSWEESQINWSAMDDLLGQHIANIF